MRIGAFPGESLLQAFQRYKVPGIHDDCNGGDAEGTMESHQIPYDYYSMGAGCAQCCIEIADPWVDKVNKVNSQEERRLSRKNEAISQTTRLSCCIQVRPELNEMICVVGNNVTEYAGEINQY